MTKNHLCVFFALLLAAPASAEMLLGTYTVVGDMNNARTEPNQFIFFVEQQIPCCQSAAMTRTYLPADVGAVSEATPTELAAMNAIIASGQNNFGITTLWNSGSFDHQIDFPFRLTRVSQRLDELVWIDEMKIPPFVTTRAGGRQTVSVYGVAVPEPCGLVLILAASLHLLRSRIVHPRRAVPLLTGV